MHLLALVSKRKHTTHGHAGEKGRRIRELTSVVQKRFKFAAESVELYAEKVADRGLCAVAQAESLRYKLLGGLAVRRYVCVTARKASIFSACGTLQAVWYGNGAIGQLLLAAHVGVALKSPLASPHNAGPATVCSVTSWSLELRAARSL